MEYNGYGFLEELLATVPTGVSEFYNFDENPFAIPPISSFEDFNLPLNETLNTSLSNFYYPFGDEQLSVPQVTETPPFRARESCSISILESEVQSLLGDGLIRNLDLQGPNCKLEPFQSNEAPIFNIGLCPGERKKREKKVGGQPSKNLMAERRRRKRLNDRLSMLRSVVPKISKMDRTSILGDTIDYMKELLERIHNLQEEKELSSDHLNLMGVFKDGKPNEVLVRNAPKFDVERREVDTRIAISCARKPGLLLSTVTTLEALGLEIQQCVISCFNDFAMQASCSEGLEQRAIFSSEEIKQALFRNAGYGGRCI
ncbi:Transcription factor bHLH93 like [Actinidia chinensis var. chinensis]|uniref:Transcription factor bHLH93 like n=1 Tax=Actinidia chinensis var. chinensis TaxID=1590841 RepID=A0A2R6Q0N9_ACTCC|nr:Transcription factor bHLH93 like [Actinidia chinensis var. chinensis]